MTALAIVPARGGSVGLPGKNLAPFRGRPLVAHTVHTAVAAGIADVVVTTDDADIAAAAEAEGARTVARPAHLADAASRTLPAVTHALDTLGVPDSTLVLLLQPTSPLRTAEDIAECLDIHADRPTGSVVQMCRSTDHHPLKVCLETPDGGIAPVRDWADLEAPRQTLPVVLRPTGGIYLVRAGDLRRHERFFIPEVRPQFVPVERAIDIDSAADLVLAEQHVTG
ncbi:MULTISPECIES: acylneuraminate cytidylyltransferase family protein [unclassified Amycolatopsis]|uniref:acylneuraminate cytidylyltransferase family protein n=1 Tax=unclassified Amycolatopsis TaxID=2618356 RepID=UPI002874BF92|nr:MULTISPECIES: acylneuraminate cytidylyltransferase family protein [unclassified Amycolatopsis]MDS0132839.1 acylneuraminate cytidylyltransferase family protein [Amycolatopsis sp. 505]MDS0142336.1 acylneuraminate cytidylyltransferase family protein [Amycolatopsis sp. CM201R]